MATNAPTTDTATWRPQTRLVRGGTHRSKNGETSEAIYMTSGYCYDSPEAAEARFLGKEPGFIYSRYANPTVAMFEERMALLEGSEAARSTASGMAAVNAALTSQLSAGDHVVASRALFGSCLYIIDDLLPRFGVASTLVDGTDLDQWRAAVRPETKCFFLETPSNPTLEVIDVAGVAGIAKAAGATLVVDNVFATPVLQRPLELGADVVVYSATKHIDGQGRCLGGVILASREFCDGALKDYLRHTGPCMSPFNAWTLLKGLETLDLRVRRHCDNARRVAEALTALPAVETVIYPGLPDHPQHNLALSQMGCGGPLVAFDIKGGKPAAFRALNRLRLIDISNNLGDAKSLVTHPATTTHQRLTPEERARLGIGDGLVRLSVGLEDVNDIVDDLKAALAP